ncbi:MAG: response regulator [Flavobacteriales bacterium]|nr:response regulator [Flavobacteriales bacterium]
MEKARMMKYALLVDDEPEICQLLSNMLRRVGAVCDMAHSVEQAKAKLSTGVYDAVFLDIHLPDGLGYDVIPEARKRNPEARLIAISAVDAERNNAVTAGADLFVPKPFNREIILRSIQALGFSA